MPGDDLGIGQKEVLDGRVGADGIGQEVVDFRSELSGAVIYDVVRHRVLTLSEYASYLPRRRQAHKIRQFAHI